MCCIRCLGEDATCILCFFCLVPVQARLASVEDKGEGDGESVKNIRQTALGSPMLAAVAVEGFVFPMHPSQNLCCGRGIRRLGTSSAFTIRSAGPAFTFCEAREVEAFVAKGPAAPWRLSALHQPSGPGAKLVSSGPVQLCC